jgi:excisionase family DNA binding protein
MGRVFQPTRLNFVRRSKEFTIMAKPEVRNVPSLLIRVEEVATLMGVSERTIWRRVSEKKFVAPVSVGSCTRWRRSDVEAFINGLKN